MESLPLQPGDWGPLNQWLAQVAGSQPVINPKTQYGAVGDGVADDTVALQAALTAAEALAAGGRSVTLFLDGVFKLNNGTAKALALTPDNAGTRGWINIVGTHRTKIVLTANTPLFLLLTKNADYDTFQKISVQDLAVVASGTAVSGGPGCILSSILANGTNQTRLNFADIVVRRVTATNLYEEASTSTSQIVGIALNGMHAGALEATQTSTQRVTIEDVDVYGGAGHSNVCSFGSAFVGGTNHYYDQIRIRRCRHQITAAPTTNGSQTSYFVCGTGFGDYCELVDCYSKNISDDGVEIGAMQTILLERLTVEDAFLEHILFRNYHALQDVDNQYVSIVDCRTTVSASLVANASASLTRWVSYNWLATAGGFGTFNFVRPYFFYDGGTSTKSLPNGGSNFIGTIGVPIKNITIVDGKVRYKNFTADRASNHDVAIVALASTTTRSKAVIRNLDVKIDGYTCPSTNTDTLHIVRVDADTTIDIDGLTCDVNGYAGTAGSCKLIEIGVAASSTVRGRIRGFIPKTGSITGISTHGVFVNSTGTLTLDKELYVEMCDFTGMNNATGSVTVDSTQRAFVKALDCAWKSTPVIVTVTVGASEYTYANANPYPALVVVSGGTVSIIKIQGVTGASQTTGLTSGTFVLRPGHLLLITYSVVPNVYTLPLH